MVKTDLPPPQSETEVFVVFQPVAFARSAKKKRNMMVIPSQPAAKCFNFSHRNKCASKLV